MPSDYTAKEAAELLGLRPSSIRAYVKSGALAATKRGRDWFISQEEIDRYNRERRGYHHSSAAAHQGTTPEQD